MSSVQFKMDLGIKVEECDVTVEECDITGEVEECDLRSDPALRGVLQELGIVKHEIIDYGTDEEYMQTEDSSEGHLYENGDNMDIPCHTGTTLPDVPNETTASKHILSHEVKKETEEEAASTEMPFHRNRIILGKKKPVSLEKPTKKDVSDINNKLKMNVNTGISIKKDHDATLIGTDTERSRKRTKEYSEMKRCLLVKVVITDCYRSLLDGGCFCARCGVLCATRGARARHELASHAAATHQRSLRERKNRVVLTDSGCQEDLETSPTKHTKRKRTGEKPFECETCKVRFWGRSEMKMHMMIHTGERPFECKICHIRFNRNNILKRHVIETHNNGEKPFECKICKRRFHRKFTLQTHITCHSTEKPYECEICKQRYKYLANLQRHSLIHCGEKPFQCKTCKQRFRLINELKRHKFSHYGGKPFKCKICKKRFSTNGDLGRHGIVHTKEKPFACVICKMTSNLRSNLKRHCGSLGHVRRALRL